jgi:predicted Holliday junction resolvase-like endonuclease
MEMEERLRKEILEKSRAVLKGRIAEQIVPFLEQFKYNPSDARFIGSPIDYIIFDGYTDVKDRNEEHPITVVLADIKTGKSASLTREQRRIKKAIEEKRVKWETITLQ